MKSNKPCPCNNQTDFNHCCGPVLAGQRPAQTAEQLMRSRYSAFCTGSVDYLIASLHPDFRQPDDRAQLAATLEHCEWLQLTILDCQQGQPNDDRGEVEFIARYRQHGQPGQLHERSRFVQQQGRWFYLDGDSLTVPRQRTGRNTPCPCGSGKKFKRCHGA